MAEIDTDICVIGAGSGGLSVAAGAAQMGAKVVLLEGHKMGGDCLNYGCVPSKALLSAARRGQDYAAAMDHVAEAVATIAPHDSQDRFEGLGVRVIREFGRFIGHDRVQAGEDVITARRFVVATGSRPVVPPIPGLADVAYLTNETLFDQRARPDHLLILGGGPIGLEMAEAHRRLGCDVTVVEAERALGREDPDAAGVVLDQLRALGVRIEEGALVSRVSGRDGEITLHTDDDRTLAGSHLLVAVGRKASLDGLDLHRAGVERAEAGVKVGHDLRSPTNRRVYAIGDAAGGMQFTHVAGYHAGVIIRPMLLGLPARARTDHIPRVAYTEPELAQVGLTEAEAREAHGDRVTVVTVEYGGNDRAIATGQTAGLIKVMVVKGRPVGATIVGAEAGELIQTWALAIANRLKMSAIAAMVAPYPTLGEINKRAAGAYFSPKLFESPWIKRIVRLVQRF